MASSWTHSPTLAGRFFTTEPNRKAQQVILMQVYNFQSILVFLKNQLHSEELLIVVSLYPLVGSLGLKTVVYRKALGNKTMKALKIWWGRKQ